jgi:hypothetical protein
MPSALVPTIIPALIGVLAYVMADENYLKIVKLAPAPAVISSRKKQGTSYRGRERTVYANACVQSRTPLLPIRLLWFTAPEGLVIEDDTDPILTRKTGRGFNRRRNTLDHNGIPLACFRVMGWR